MIEAIIKTQLHIRSTQLPVYLRIYHASVLSHIEQFYRGSCKWKHTIIHNGSSYDDHDGMNNYQDVCCFAML